VHECDRWIEHSTGASVAITVAVVHATAVEISHRLKGRFSQANGLLIEAEVGVF